MNISCIFSSFSGSLEYFFDFLLVAADLAAVDTLLGDAAASARPPLSALPTVVAHRNIGTEQEYQGNDHHLNQRTYLQY